MQILPWVIIVLLMYVIFYFIMRYEKKILTFKLHIEKLDKDLKICNELIEKNRMLIEKNRLYIETNAKNISANIEQIDTSLE